MIIILEKRARAQLYDLADIIDDLNISGAGERWVNRFLEHLRGYAKASVSYALCRDAALASRGYSCIIYNGKWIVAFKLTNDELRVYEILHGALLQ
ncbi:MAG: hypothetical protein JST90_18715 [Bacteroidetes bacterium]|nr:hypothetical protein [Bacteroidota bacterium]